MFLNAFKLELLRTSRGSSFHCLAAVIVNEFSKILVLELGTRSNSLSTERKCRLCESDTLVKRSSMYSTPTGTPRLATVMKLKTMLVLSGTTNGS